MSSCKQLFQALQLAHSSDLTSPRSTLTSLTSLFAPKPAIAGRHAGCRPRIAMVVGGALIHKAWPHLEQPAYSWHRGHVRELVWRRIGESRSRERRCACGWSRIGLWLSRKQRRSFHQPRSRHEADMVEPGVTPNKKGENTRFSPLKECFGYLEVHSECSLPGTISGVLCGLCPDQRAKG